MEKSTSSGSSSYQVTADLEWKDADGKACRTNADNGNASLKLASGIGYLDHMLDQLKSHAQLQLSVMVVSKKRSLDEASNGNGNGSSENNENENPNRLATHNQSDLLSAIGTQVGLQLRALLKNNPNARQESVFLCPLDEALVECCITRATEESATTDADVKGRLDEYTLAPYGSFPKATGRKHIGQLETAAIEFFWRAVSESSGLVLKFQKHRGTNAHHIVESSFKAFSRALRKLLDSSDTFAINSPNDNISRDMDRAGTVSRSTKETSIEVNLALQPKSDDRPTTISTGIAFLDQFLQTLADEATLSLSVSCKGDIWVDEHHTAEDVSIAIGQCLTHALGTKAGLNRMWVEAASLGDAKVQVTMDLSNRPCWDHDFHALWEESEYIDSEKAGITDAATPLTCEMMEHVLESLVMNSRMTAHFQVLRAGKDLKETMLCTAMAFGRALRVCAMVDARRAGQTASSKGTLSA